jgi:plasmid maintenance system killer protein
VIKSFRDRDVKELFTHRNASRRLEPYAKAALRKLDQIDVIHHIEQLFVPPGNRLKKLDTSGKFGSTSAIAFDFSGTGSTHTTSRLETFTNGV